MNKNKIEDWTGEIHQGDAVETLSEIPESSIHMSMCSPPYYGLRDYNKSEQIGLEETVDGYVKEIVKVGDELKRVLRDDGSWWLNIGDSYAGSGGAGGDWQTNSESVKPNPTQETNPAELNGTVRNGCLKNTSISPKSKMMIPHRIAIELEKSGWIVRNNAIWQKRGGGMPENVSDRLSAEFEFLFHFTLNQDYYYDMEAIEVPSKSGNGSKNPGNIINVSTASHNGTHCAVYPEKLCKIPIKSSCPKEVCSECGTGYNRNKENKKVCNCDTTDSDSGIVLDPFSGSGTTLVAAENLERDWIGIELNFDYIEVSEERIRNDTGILQDNPLDY